MSNSTKQKIKCPAGSYLVIIKGNAQDQMPKDHCYEMRQDYDGYTFMPCLDIKGSTSNGWANYPDLEVREATEIEIKEYKRLGKPYDVTKLVKKEEIINNYSIF